MQFVERHVIRPDHAAFRGIDNACFASKNLYNQALYEVRQNFFATSKVFSQAKLDKMLKNSEEYRALPAKVAQLVLMQEYDSWVSYCAALTAYKKDPSLFLGKPRIPKYLDKKGRNLLHYNKQAFSKKALKKRSSILPTGLFEIVQTKQNPETVTEIRIVPRSSNYVVEVVYEVKEPVKTELDKSLYASIDMGVVNLATVTFNRPGMKPFAVSGRELKSLNQFYNKRKAELLSLLPKGHYKSHQINAMNDKRYWRMQDMFHKASRYIVNQLIKGKVATLIIGKNDGWKQDVNMGKKNNQEFCFIPHARFIKMLTYKAEMAGIHVICQEESYTSKCSFLDNEPICKQEKYLGRRVKRGLFRSANGILINADCNGSYNHLRKFDANVFPDPVERTREGAEGYVVHPIRVNFKLMNSKKLNQTPTASSSLSINV
jgi:putative transposase